MNGTYTENPAFFKEATLQISKNDFEIRFYYPGPDLRHNGHFQYIRSSEIELYIEALKSNFEKYENFKSLGADGTLSSLGEKNMYISSSKSDYCSGVRLSIYSKQYIKTSEDLKMAIDSLLEAKERGEKLMAFMQSID